MLSCAVTLACGACSQRSEAQDARRARERRIEAREPIRERAEPDRHRAARSATTRAPRGLRDLGALPVELASLRWPARPRISRTVEVTSPFALQRAVDAPRTRVRVVAPIDDAITVHASDVEIVITGRGRLGRVSVDPGVRRVRVTGGAIESIELLPPARWTPEPDYDEDLLVEDVTLDRLRVEAADSAFVVRGRRVAVIDCDVRAERYSLWAGDTGPLDGEDLIVAGNTFRSAGPESTLRIHDVARSVVVDNVLSNGRKHTYRVHGRSDLAYASRNVLVRTGVMIGNQPGDDVGTVVFERNTMYLEEPSMLEVDFDAIRHLVLRDNVVYTDRWQTFFPYPRVREGWVVERNERHPFRPYEGPARIGR